MDGPLWYAYVNLTDNGFSGWSKLPGRTPWKPIFAASEDGLLYLIVRGSNNRIYLNVLEGGVWKGWIALPRFTSVAPSTAVLGDKLHIVVKGSRDNSIWHGVMDTVSWKWLGWSRIPGSTPSVPDLASDQKNNRLYLAVRGSNNRIYINIYEEELGWLGWIQVPSDNNPTSRHSD